MNTVKSIFDQLLQVTTNLIHNTPALHQFAVVPDDLQYVYRIPVYKPVIDCLAIDLPTMHLPAGHLPAGHLPATHLPQASTPAQPLIDALLNAAPYAQWRTTYTADQLGTDFINRYGYIELYGPEGHYNSRQSRAFIGYWGNHLNYPLHSHEAEEIYYIVAGEALFGVDDHALQLRQPQDTQTHSAWQSHRMITENSAVLCLVLWRGGGLAGSASLNN